MTELLTDHGFHIGLFLFWAAVVALAARIVARERVLTPDVAAAMAVLFTAMVLVTALHGAIR